MGSSVFSFPTLVADVTLRATVVAEEGEGRDFLFRVRFDDGNEDVFFIYGKKIGVTAALHPSHMPRRSNMTWVILSG